MYYSNLSEEKNLWKKGYKRVVCLDEVGRGPLAGSVTAAAVTLKEARTKKEKEGLRFLLKEIKDSKKVSPKKREIFYNILIAHPAIDWGLGRVSERVIDRINIYQATKLAMKRAVRNLEKRSSRNNILSQPDFLILDGKMKLNLPFPQKALIKADEKVFSCSAASIIAKVRRDRMMRRYHLRYPQYCFNIHKGYSTELHRKMLKKHGLCQIHRRSFKMT